MILNQFLKIVFYRKEEEEFFLLFCPPVSPAESAEIEELLVDYFTLPTHICSLRSLG
jgi:hypothetical protein